MNADLSNFGRGRRGGSDVGGPTNGPASGNSAVGLLGPRGDQDRELLEATDPKNRIPDAVGTTGAPTTVTDDEVPGGLLDDLHRSDLVISDGYVGPDRRATGFVPTVRRRTFRTRRWLVRVEVVVVCAAAALLTSIVSFSTQGRGATVPRTPYALVVHRDGKPGPLTTGGKPATSEGSAANSTHPGTAASGASHPGSPTSPASSPAVAPTPTAATPLPAPSTSAPPATAPPATTAPVASPVASAALTPDQLGAEALRLVTYPWRSIPGYSIRFLPISDAPSPGFLGNTVFTWGQAGGVSSLYVYPGETASQLAGIVAFEIGHEVDAAGVYPGGGERVIENLLGIHPGSWAPNCDCAEQNFLSGWYAAAFSNYWSPGVGNWSALAAEPSGNLLAEIRPWLNPAIR